MLFVEEFKGLKNISPLMTVPLLETWLENSSSHLLIPWLFEITYHHRNCWFVEELNGWSIKESIWYLYFSLLLSACREWLKRQGKGSTSWCWLVPDNPGDEHQCSVLQSGTQLGLHSIWLCQVLPKLMSLPLGRP